MASIAAIAARIEHLARRRSIGVETQFAGTGTRYLTLDAGEEKIKVRVADHAECYCSEDYSVDPYTGSIEPVLAWIKAHGETPIAWSKARAEKAARLLTEAGWPAEVVPCSPPVARVVIAECVAASIDNRGAYVRDAAPANLRSAAHRIAREMGVHNPAAD